MALQIMENSMASDRRDASGTEKLDTTILDTAGIADYRSVIGYFAQAMMKELRLVGGYDVLYGKVKAFV